MRKRCRSPNSKDYRNYGARGIKVCERWSSFTNFLSDMGERPKGLMLERKDNDLGYNPDNCIWDTRTVNNRNKRDTKLTSLKAQVIKKLLKESMLTIKDIAEIFGVTTCIIYDIRAGRTWKSVLY